MAVSTTAQRRERLSELVGPIVARCGLDLEDLAVAGAGRRQVVRVVVDGDAGVTLDDIAKVSTEISAALDEAEALLGSTPYTLEVTSPGVDRPLTEPRHWRRNTKRLVRVRAGDEQIEGRIVSTDDRGVGIDVSGEVRQFDYSELGPGKVQVEFGREEGEGV